jgi:hypothetical protein
MSGALAGWPSDLALARFPVGEVRQHDPGERCDVVIEARYHSGAVGLVAHAAPGETAEAH